MSNRYALSENEGSSDNDEVKSKPTKSQEYQSSDHFREAHQQQQQNILLKILNREVNIRMQ